MARMIRPWQVLVVAAAGWISREQDSVIEYLREENRVLKQQLGGRRLRLTYAQRRRLAAQGKALGYRVLSEVATIVTPDTILRWHRRLIAGKWDYSAKRRDPGRPHHRGQDPRAARNRSRSGAKQAHAMAHVSEGSMEYLAATDFFTIEVWRLRGLVTFYLLIVIELSTRRVHLAGITPNPNTAWMMQMGRNLTDPDGVLAGKRFIIMDRDSKFCDAFRTMLSESGTEPLRLPPRRMSATGMDQFDAVNDSAAFCVTTFVRQRSGFTLPSHDQQSFPHCRSDCPATDLINGPYGV